jgi:methionine synthase / methylenetetrahydrofolate reductase(NADPH)
MRPSFLEAVDQGPIVFDGAVGTQLYERGIYINKSFDSANLSHQDIVASVHRAYIEAGADVITTNTFSANRIKLKRHGLDEQIADVIHQGVRIAKEEAAGKAFVAGSMGPTGLTPTMLTDEELEAIRQAFFEQASLLANAGADLIVLETFRQLAEIKIALGAVRAACDLPIVAQMSFDADHKTGDGAEPERVALLLRQWGADIVGANCLEGPNVIYDVVVEMVGCGAPVIAQPNAGYPRRVDERLVYMATPEYFGVYARRFFKAGVRLVGGCCGTGPEHVRQIAAAARMFGGGRQRVYTPRVVFEQPSAESSQEIPVAARTALADKITRVYQERVLAGGEAARKVTRDSFVVSVEVNPPAGLDPSKAVEAARMLIEGGVDVINIADGPRASVRMANWALGQLIEREIGAETIIHFCGRDRNLLGLQADVLAFHVMGLHNLVVITGDPPKVGDYPHATAVFDLDSIGILRMIHHFNQGIDPAGKPVGDVTRFYCACGAEPAAQDYERELRRLELKKAAGARFIMTQPVYDPELLDRFLKDTAHLEMPVLVGLLPLASYRNAEFLHNEVPGMAVPEDVRERMKAAGSGPEARKEGVKIAQETLDAVKDRVVGAYIMPPFGRYQAALEILSGIDGY